MLGIRAGDGENKLLDIGSGGPDMREDLAKPRLPPGNGDGHVVREEVPTHEAMVHGGRQHGSHGGRGNHGQPHRHRPRGHVVHGRRVQHRRHRGAGHRERVGPPCQREAEPPTLLNILNNIVAL